MDNEKKHESLTEQDVTSNTWRQPGAHFGNLAASDAVRHAWSFYNNKNSSNAQGFAISGGAIAIALMGAVISMTTTLATRNMQAAHQTLTVRIRNVTMAPIIINVINANQTSLFLGAPPLINSGDYEDINLLFINNMSQNSITFSISEENRPDLSSNNVAVQFSDNSHQLARLRSVNFGNQALGNQPIFDPHSSQAHTEVDSIFYRSLSPTGGIVFTVISGSITDSSSGILDLTVLRGQV